MVIILLHRLLHSLSKNNGNLYAFDTIYTTYDGAEIPRVRSCKNIRNPQQETFIATDCGFTIESGNTDWLDVVDGDLYLITEDGKKYITEGAEIFLSTEAGDLFITEAGDFLLSEQVDPSSFFYLIAEQPDVHHLLPAVAMSISIDGGDHFSSYDTQYLPPIGQRKNKLAWWQLGWSNDLVCQFRFHGLGRFVATDGVVNVRQ